MGRALLEAAGRAPGATFFLDALKSEHHAAAVYSFLKKCINRARVEPLFVAPEKSGATLQPFGKFWKSGQTEREWDHFFKAHQKGGVTLQRLDHG